MNLIPGIESTGSALSAEKIRLEIIAQNIANSNTTQDASKCLQRKEVAEEYIKTRKTRSRALTKIYIRVFGLMFTMIKRPVE